MIRIGSQPGVKLGSKPRSSTILLRSGNPARREQGRKVLVLEWREKLRRAAIYAAGGTPE